ncbi:MAG: LysR substrate-binding domain-containing protein [Pseudomonadota bacterium]
MFQMMDILLFQDLDQLRRTGNFSQAAELRNLSQPAFSRRIKSLESWVGVMLVDRSRQPVKLTEAGVQMLEAGLQAIARIEAERSQLREAQSLPDRYVVTFAAQHSIGWRFFPAWLQALEEAHGPLLSRLRADDLPICLQDLRNGDVDFVIAYFDTGASRQSANLDRSFEKVTIGTDRLVPVCKPAQNGAPLFNLPPHEGAVPLLRFGEAAPLGRLLDPLLESVTDEPGFRTVYENTMAGALRIRARDGAGVAWLPESLVAPDLDAGLLTRTGDEAWVMDLKIALLRKKGNTNRLTRSIWAFLQIRESVGLLPAGWSLRPADRSV